ncbi:MAG: sigma-70 family RNA polymerase sigma factor, partial [Acidobacteria bacterium]|nr:sigma-70 family RNA polymerase sigma factor [Acidobacteriota bacterium]
PRFDLSKRMADATLNPAIPFAGSGPEAPALDSDAALMARVQAGDLDAFEPLVQRYERRLFGYFVNLVEDPAAAADLAQETFVRVYRAAGRYQETGKFESWLFRIASNLVRSRQRRPDQRRPHLPLEEAPAGARELAATGREARPDEATWRAEVRDALQQALPRLPLVFREAVLLRDVEGRSYREIAEMLGVEEGTVKSRAHRGRKHLRELLAPMFEEAMTRQGCYEGVS